MKVLIIIFFVFLVLFQISFAQIPQTLSFQGVLTDNTGNPITDGDYNLTFRLYETESEGTALWTEEQSTTVVTGIFNVILGKVTSLSIPFDKSYWLGISIDSGTELSPRIELTSTAYSLTSRSVYGNSNVFPSEGNVGIGTNLPEGQLQVGDGQTTNTYISIRGSRNNSWNASSLNFGDELVNYRYRMGIRGSNEDNNANLRLIYSTVDPQVFFTALGVYPETLNNINYSLGLHNNDFYIDTFGNIGIGTMDPSTKLEVSGMIHSNNGGFKFPDGSVQITAYSGGNGSGGGDITAVTAGDGLTGGGETGGVTIDIEGGIGINVSPDSVSMDTIFVDARYINEREENSITSNMIIDGQVQSEDISEGAVGSVHVLNNSLTSADLAENSVGTSEVSDNSLLAEDLGVNVISSIDGIIHDGGNIELVAGDNVTITPDEENHRITISAVGGITGDFIKKDTPDTSRGTSSVPLLSITNLGEGEGINGYSVAGDGISGSSENNFGTVGWTAGSSDKSGVFGFSSAARGVLGRSDNNDGTVGWTGASDKSGVFGHSTNGFGVTGRSDTNDGVVGWSGGSDKSGVYGFSDIMSGVGVRGRSDQGHGVNGIGYFGIVGDGTHVGVWGKSGAHGFGIWTQGDSAAIVAFGTGLFFGGVHVSGYLEKAGGGFKIDHPLDPANKYLNHSFVESPDMKNVYDGVVILDSNGEATVDLPDWFEALNSDFRYQLTCIGGYAPVYILQEISNNQFRISGGSSGMKVSWQVTGIRQDEWAKKNPIEVEQEKINQELGKYLHPEAFGLSETLGIHYSIQKRMMDNNNKMETSKR